MSNDYYDIYLCERWNRSITNSRLPQERFWDLCRIFEEHGYLIKNPTAVSTLSIGPFRIATSLSLEKKDFLLFFAEIIIPVLVTESTITSLEDIWQFILLPLTNVCINLLDKTCYVKDKLAWKILLYIKNKNKNAHYPTLTEIKTMLPNKDRIKTRETVKILLSYKNILGSSNALIEKVNNGYKSFV